MLKKCGHVMCKECMKKVCSKEKKCPICMKVFNENELIGI